MSDDTKKLLDTIEKACDQGAERHSDGCTYGQVARSLGNIVREVKSDLAAGSGPAQVATNQYRNNWDGIFGKKQVVGVA